MIPPATTPVLMGLDVVEVVGAAASDDALVALLEGVTVTWISVVKVSCAF